MVPASVVSDVPSDPVDRLARALGGDRPDLEDVAVALTLLGCGPAATEDGDAAAVARDVGHRLDAEAATPDVESAGDALELTAALFSSGRFTGDRIGYGSIDDNRLDRVLTRRTGIPLTLAVVAALVGRRVGHEVEIVGLPGHVLTRDPVSGLFVDVFDLGRRAPAEQVRGWFGRRHPSVRWDPGFLEPMSLPAIAGRWARNLRAACTRAGDREGIEWSWGAEVVADPSSTGAVVGLSEWHASRGDVLGAARLLESAATRSPRAAELRSRARQLRAGLN